MLVVFVVFVVVVVVVVVGVVVGVDAVCVFAGLTRVIVI